MIARRGFVLFLCLASIGIAADDEASKVYVKVPDDFKAYLLDERSPEDQVTGISAKVPIVTEIEGQSAKFKKADIVAIAHGDGATGVVVSDFKIADSIASKGSLYDLLEFRKSGTPSLRPGDYRFLVNLELEALDKNGKPLHQTIQVVLKRAAPVIGIGDTVVIRQTITCNGPKTYAGKLRLREDSRRVDLNQVHLVVMPNQAETQRTDARVRFYPDLFDIGRGAAVSLTPVIDGEFPLGTSKGKIEVSSPDLAEVKSVNYEVRASRSDLWILGCIVLGLLFGVIVRGLITKFRERASAKLELSKVVGSGNEFRSRIRDAKFRARIDEVLFTLVPMATAKDTEALAKLGKEQLDALRVEFQQKLVTAEKSLLELDRFLRLPWDLPSAAQEAILRARRRLVSALGLLEMQDPHSCVEMQEDIILSDLTPAVNAALSWHRHLADYFTGLNAGRPPLFAGDLIQLENVSRELAGTRPAMPNFAIASPAVAQPLLEAARARWVTLEKLVGWLGRGLLEFAEHGIQALEPPPGLQPKSEALRKHARDMVAHVKEHLRGNGDPTRDARVLTEAARRAWLELIEALDRGEEVRDKFKKLMDAGQWEAAIEAARLQSDMVAETAGTLQADSLTRSPREVLDLLAKPMGRGSGSIVLQGTRQEQASILARILRLDLARSLILAFILVGAALLYYGESWVGTNKDLAGLFLLAFSTDLTADGLTKFFKL